MTPMSAPSLTARATYRSRPSALALIPLPALSPDSATAGDRPGAITPAARPVLADLAHAGRRKRRIDRPQSASRQAREQHPPAATIETGLRYPVDAGQPAPRLDTAIEQAQPGALVRIAFNHQQLVLGCTVQGLQRLLRRHRQRLQALISR
ncbi:hypothetical protein G6F22_019484 [Rhizopus arrhizus]|nr:hypothetical protein G6F22_019484 [Rhizopus arrhizus]